MSKACGCLIGIVLGFIFAVIIAVWGACSVFKSNPEKIWELCREPLRKISVMALKPLQKVSIKIEK